MSCRDGEKCDEARKRLRALAMLGIMALVFIVLSVFSFVGSRNQVVPDQFAVGDYQATAGKRVFQAYNCMDCHTIVGNGGYFGPDLTDIYKQAGPAWLAAFLPSAGHWPTEAALKVQLANDMIAEDAGVTSLTEYYNKYPAAKQRIDRRGGEGTYMPSLRFSKDEIYRLVAFLKYTSAMNNEGWPPEIKVDKSLDERVALAHSGGLWPGTGVVPAAAAATTAAPADAASARQSAADDAGNDDGEALVAKGEELVTSYGCTACHSTTDKRIVGPGWGSAYGATITLHDGSTATVDEEYLVESIRQPAAKARKDFPKGVMPTYSSDVISDADLDAIVAYLRSLEK